MLVVSFSRIACLWNSISVSCFPDELDLHKIKCNGNRYLIFYGLHLYFFRSSRISNSRTPNKTLCLRWFTTLPWVNSFKKKTNPKNIVYKEHRNCSCLTVKESESLVRVKVLKQLGLRDGNFKTLFKEIWNWRVIKILLKFCIIIQNIVLNQFSCSE